MRKIIPIVLFFFSTQNSIAQNWLWASGAGGSSTDVSYSIAHYSEGSTFITGAYSSTAAFGTHILNGNANPYTNIFIAKYTAAGNVVWAKQAGGPNYNDCAYGISLDAAGNVFITGYFQDTAYFSTDTLISSGYEDIFVAKYDSSGNELWARQAGGSLYNDAGFGISNDASGNVFVTGYITGQASFGNITLLGSNNDIFVAEYDASGNILWAKNAGSGTDDQGRGIKTDAAGNSFVTGYFQGTATFGINSVTSSGSLDGFIAKYDVNGNIVWVMKIGGANADVGNSIAIDALDNSYIAGVSNGNAFATKYYSNGNPGWWRQASGNNVAYGIGTDANGNFSMTGYMTTSSTFGSTILNPISSQDIFISKNDSAGNTLWAYNTGSNAFNCGYAIFVDDSCNTIVTGYFDNAINFGTHSISGAGSDVFLAKVNTCATGIEDLKNELSVNVFPDPATEILNFQFEQEMNGSITIFDATGRKAEEIKFSQKKFSVDVSAFSPGIYFAEIKTSKGNFFAKFIKE